MAESPAPQYKVARPGGGSLILVSQDEVEVWEELRDKYIKDYQLAKANDLALLGTILSQHLVIFRAEQKLNGMVPELDHGQVPTGRYKHEPPKDSEITSAHKAINSASKEIRELESSLGVDKKTREAGGQHTVADYVTKLKKAGHQMGVHITKRTLAYEEFCMELKWKIRLLENGDEEDRNYHDLSPEKVLEWAGRELARLEEVDKKFANEKGKLFIGEL